jgi:diacylglycerol kinase (ATP)
MPHSRIHLARTEYREPSDAKRFAMLGFPTTASGTTAKRHARAPLDGADDTPLKRAVPNGLWRSSVSVRAQACKSIRHPRHSIDSALAGADSATCPFKGREHAADQRLHSKENQMKTDQNARLARPQMLAHAQHKQAQQLKKAERARYRLEKATQKLRRREAAIAAIVQPDRATYTQPAGQTAPQPAKLRRARVIFNPQSKGAVDGTYRPEQIADCLRTYGIAAEMTLKTSGKVARKLAKAAVKQGMELVIVAAGDGTIEDVAGQLVGTKTTLGIIPIGTMNNLARALGVPLNLDDACALLGMGITRHIDVGRITTTDTPKGVYFLEMAGVGLSALAAPLGQDAEKGRWAKLVETLGKAFAFKGATVTITCDDDEAFQTQTQVVTVSNSPLFAENMLIGPDAKLDDGMLDVACYADMSTTDLERHFLAIANGKRVDDPRITFRRVRRIRVSAGEPLAANADLHVLAPQQVWDIAIVSGALSAVVGNGVGLTLPVEAVSSVPPLAGPQPTQTTGDGQQRANTEQAVVGTSNNGYALQSARAASSH